MVRILAAIAAAGFAACACSPEGAQRPAIDPRLESGVTSSNGGGQRTTGGYTSINVGGGGTTATSQGPTSAGRGL